MSTFRLEKRPQIASCSLTVSYISLCEDGGMSLFEMLQKKKREKLDLLNQGWTLKYFVTSVVSTAACLSIMVAEEYNMLTIAPLTQPIYKALVVTHVKTPLVSPFGIAERRLAIGNHTVMRRYEAIALSNVNKP